MLSFYRPAPPDAVSGRGMRPHQP